VTLLPERREKQERLISAGRRESIAIDHILPRAGLMPSKAGTILSMDSKRTKSHSERSNTRGQITPADPWPNNENFSLCYQDPTRIVMDWEHKLRREALGSYKDHTLIEKRKVRYPRSQNKPSKPKMVKVSPTRSTQSRKYLDIHSEDDISRSGVSEEDKLEKNSPRSMQFSKSPLRQSIMHNLLDDPINEYDWEPLAAVPMAGSDIPDCLSVISETSSIEIENPFPGMDVELPMETKKRFPEKAFISPDDNCFIESFFTNNDIRIDQKVPKIYSTPKPDVSNLNKKAEIKSYQTPIDHIAPFKQIPSTVTKVKSISPSPSSDEEISRPNGFELYKDNPLVKQIRAESISRSQSRRTRTSTPSDPDDGVSSSGIYNGVTRSHAPSSIGGESYHSHGQGTVSARSVGGFSLSQTLPEEYAIRDMARREIEQQI